jgi:hypothetical protein
VPLSDERIEGLWFQTGIKPGQRMEPKHLREFVALVRRDAAEDVRVLLEELRDRHRVSPYGAARTVEEEITLKGRNTVLSCIGLVERELFS